MATRKTAKAKKPGKRKPATKSSAKKPARKPAAKRPAAKQPAKLAAKTPAKRAKTPATKRAKTPSAKPAKQPASRPAKSAPAATGGLTADDVRQRLRPLVGEATLENPEMSLPVRIIDWAAMETDERNAFAFTHLYMFNFARGGDGERLVFDNEYLPIG